MQLYTFTRGLEKLSTPAGSLHDATLLLPIDWKHGPSAGFSVVITPIDNETDYWKAQCKALEFQLQQVLGERHAQ